MNIAFRCVVNCRTGLRRESMKELELKRSEDTLVRTAGETPFPARQEWSTTSWTPGSAMTISSPHERLMELESENHRLRRLVAELLVKNQAFRLEM